MSKPADPPLPAQAPTTAFYAAETYRTEESVGLMMRKVITALARSIDHELAEADLTNAQWVPLYKLYTGCATTAAELARESHLDAGAMTRLLDRLEAKGLCARSRSDSDRRVIKIALTEAGKKAATDVPRALSNVQNQLLSGFSAEEFATLKGYLLRMLANAEAGTGGLPPLPQLPTGDMDAV